MSEQDAEQEPSIEEILSSIRQIIADDDEDSPVEAEPATDDAADEEVIDLTEAVEPEPAPEPEPEPEPEVIVEPEAEPEEIEVALEDLEPEPIKEEPIMDLVMEEVEESLLTNSAEGAALEGFSEIVRKTAVEHNGITVEEIVRTELRPMLKGWLDSNLPSMIERLVQEELQRVSKRALGED